MNIHRITDERALAQAISCLQQGFVWMSNLSQVAKEALKNGKWTSYLKIVPYRRGHKVCLKP